MKILCFYNLLMGARTIKINMYKSKKQKYNHKSKSGSMDCFGSGSKSGSKSGSRYMSWSGYGSYSWSW
jgi:hypothetical protein